MPPPARRDLVERQPELPAFDQLVGTFERPRGKAEPGALPRLQITTISSIGAVPRCPAPAVRRTGPEPSAISRRSSRRCRHACKVVGEKSSGFLLRGAPPARRGIADPGENSQKVVVRGLPPAPGLATVFVAAELQHRLHLPAIQSSAGADRRRPVVGPRIPAMIEIRVVLPQPDGPTSIVSSPAGISRSMPCTTSTAASPMGKDFVTPRQRTATSGPR